MPAYKIHLCIYETREALKGTLKGQGPHVHLTPEEKARIGNSLTFQANVLCCHASAYLPGHAHIKYNKFI